MKPPVLVIGPRAVARAVASHLQAQFTVTIEEESPRAHALASLGAHLAIVAIAPAKVEGAIAIDAVVDHAALLASVTARVSRRSEMLREAASTDDVSALEYDHYLELSRYALTRRYLACLLETHHGTVTDAARAAGLKRESLHRLLRRHHIAAEEFRPNDQGRPLKSSDRTP